MKLRSGSLCCNSREQTDSRLRSIEVFRDGVQQTVDYYRLNLVAKMVLLLLLVVSNLAGATDW